MKSKLGRVSQCYMTSATATSALRWSTVPTLPHRHDQIIGKTTTGVAHLTRPFRPSPGGRRRHRRDRRSTRPPLLLGVTPELADIASDLDAVDRNHPLCRMSGRHTRRRAMVGTGSTTTPGLCSCARDGSLSVSTARGGVAVSSGSARRSGAGDGLPVASMLHLTTVSRWLPSKRRPMADRFGIPCVQVASRHGDRRRGGPSPCWRQRDFRGVPDHVPRPRRAGARNGWDRGHIDTIDYYESSVVAYSFPTRRQLRDHPAKLHEHTAGRDRNLRTG